MNLEEGYSLIVDKLESWLNTAIEMLPNLAAALLVIALFYVIASIIKKYSGKLLHKVTHNKTIVNLAQTVLGVVILGAGVFIALGILNLDGTVTSLLAGAGIIGLALGFAFQDIAANFISGILLSVRHPFGIGDIIESNGYYGTVQKLNLRNTKIKTPQGQIVYIPNKEVYENPFTNFTKNNERRIDLQCGVSYGDDLEKARSITLDAISGLEGINKDKGIEFYYEEFGGSSINYVVRFWVDFSKNPDFWSPRSEAIMAIKKAYDENDIMIPFPIRTLDFGIRGGEKLNTMLKEGTQMGSNASDGGEG
jgi:small-conductance mechanosensitive channel